MMSVEVAIYDLSQGMALQMSEMSATLLDGKRIEMIPHTGIRAFGLEWFYGGGIQSLAPASVESTFGAKPKRIESLGSTNKTKAELEAFLRSQASEWTAERYDLWRHNCNNFSEVVAQFLVGQSIPSWILSLPSEVLATPLGQMLETALKPMQDQMNAQLLAQGGVLETSSLSAEYGEDTNIEISLRRSTDPQNQSTQSVRLSKNATVADVRKAAGLSSEHRLVFLGKVLKSPTASLSSLGLDKDGLTILVVPPKEESIDSLVSRVTSIDALKALSGIVTKVIEHPDTEKYRRLKLENTTFQRKVSQHDGTLPILYRAGFQEVENCLILSPSASAWTPLNQVKHALDTAIRSRTPPAVPAQAPIPSLASAFPSGFPMPPHISSMPAESQAAMARFAMNPEISRLAMETLSAHPELAQLSLGNGNGPPDPQRVQEIMRSNPQLNQQIQNSVMRIMQNPQLAQDFMHLSSGATPGIPPWQAGHNPGIMPPPPSLNNAAPPPAAASAPQTPPAATSTSTNPPRPEDAMTEEEAILEAIRRSLREQ